MPREKTNLKSLSKRMIIGVKLSKKSSIIRGSLITMTILLEETIDRWLVAYFSHNEIRKNELFKLVFCHDRISFSSKCAVFMYIINEHCKDFKIEYPNINKHLAEIYEDRNILAHSMWDLNEDYKSRKSANYTKRKSTSETNKSFLHEDLNGKIERICMYIDAVEKLVHPPLN